MNRPSQKSTGGLSRLTRALRYSVQGLGAAWRDEAAFRQELAVVAPLAPLAFWLGESALQVAALLASLLCVLVAELFNSAIEAAIDRISVERHPLSEKAKDLGSAAVLLSIAMAGIVWTAVAWTRWSP